MKAFIIVGVIAVFSCAQAGVVPASTTLIRQSTAVAHSPAIAYTQPITYSSPLAYSVVPSVYSQPLFSRSYYSSPLIAHGSVLAQQSIFAQYPGLVAQNPIVQYPFVQQGVVGQLPVEAQIPAQGGLPVVGPQNPPSQQEPQGPPQAPPQQSPILSGPSPGTTADDDTVSVEAA